MIHVAKICTCSDPQKRFSSSVHLIVHLSRRLFIYMFTDASSGLSKRHQKQLEHLLPSTFFAHIYIVQKHPFRVYTSNELCRIIQRRIRWKAPHTDNTHIGNEASCRSEATQVIFQVLLYAHHDPSKVTWLFQYLQVSQFIYRTPESQVIDAVSILYLHRSLDFHFWHSFSQCLNVWCHFLRHP